jgi:hypothetical protein
MKTRLELLKIKLMPALIVVAQVAVLIVVASALLYPAPFTSNLLPAGWLKSDLVVSSWPDALLIQRTFARDSRLPLWDPYFGGGQPVGADPLAALFYPPTHLVHFLSLRNYFLVIIMGHLVFAGLGALLLARRALGLPRLPALAAGVAFMATPRLLSHLGAGHVTIVQTVSWYPWLALACWATVREPRRWGAVFGLCMALTLLAGHPQMAYYGLVMICGLSGWLLVQRWRAQGWSAALLSLTALGAAGGIGALVAAIHLLPLMEFTARSTRQLSVRSTDAYPFGLFIHALLDQRPNASLPWEGMLTPGLVVLALAALAAVVRWRKTWPLLLGLLLVAGLTMGHASWFYLAVARLLPDLDRFRGLARIWFLALLLLSLLTGVGTDWLVQRVRRIRSQGAPVISAALGVLIVLLIALSLVQTDTGYARVNDVIASTTPSVLARSAAHLAGSGRIYGVQENLPQVSAVQLQASLADGWDPLLLQSYVSYMERAGGYSAQGYQLHIPVSDAPWVEPKARLLGWMHVSVVLSRRPLSDPLLVLVGKEDGTLIYQNTADAGPAYLLSPGQDGNPPSPEQAQQLNIRVRVLTLAPEQETFTFSSDTVGYFVIATPAFPGWNSEVDGHPVPAQLFAGVMPTIKVDPGTHTFSYSYAPFSVRLGALMSLAGLLAALTWFIVGRFWKPRKPSRPREGQSEDGARSRADDFSVPIQTPGKTRILF